MKGPQRVKTISLSRLGGFASRDGGGLTVDAYSETLDPDSFSGLVEHLRGGGTVPPVLLDGDLLRDGHHRYAAAKAAGIKSLPYTRSFREHRETNG